MARVAHYPHDSLWDLPDRQSMTDRVLVGKKATGQRFVNDRYQRRLGAILGGKGPSSPHLDAHRLKIVGADIIYFNHRLCATFERCASFDLKQHAVTRSVKRKEIGQAGRLDTRQRLDARERFLEISAALWRIRWV